MYVCMYVCIYLLHKYRLVQLDEAGQTASERTVPVFT